MSIKDARLKRAEMQASMYREELTALLEAAVDGIIVIDQTGTIETFSHAAELMFGYEAGEVIGRNIRVLMPDSYAHDHDRHLREYVEKREPHIIGAGREVEGRRKDGSVFPVYLAVGEFRLEGYSRFVGIVRDITATRKATEALKAQRDQTQEYLDLADAIMLVLKPDATIQLINKKGCEVLGRSEADLIGRDWIDTCLPDEGRGVVREVFESIAAGKIEPYRYYENTVLAADGSERLVAWHNALRKNDEGRVTGILSSGQDITEVRDAEREARETRERLTHIGRLSTMGEMAAGLAHEINQPLTAIASYSQACLRLLQTGSDDPDSLRDALTKVGVQAQRAGEVIRRLRSFVKKKDSRRERADCNALLRNVIMLAEADARASGIRIETKLEPELPQVKVDSVQIQQVVLNLVRNAIDATLDTQQKNTPIRISTRRGNNGMIAVSVADRGSGISAASQGEVFNPFFTTKGDGLGMGLSISRSIVRSHGGNLRFSSNEGGGTVFEFDLPVADGE